MIGSTVRNDKPVAPTGSNEEARAAQVLSTTCSRWIG